MGFAIDTTNSRRITVGLVYTLVIGALAGTLVLGILALTSAHHIGNALLHLLTPYPAPVQANPALQQQQNYTVSWVADIEDPRINESSGLAASSVHADTLYTINDSGSGSTVFALGLDGRTRAVLRLPVKATDWETLATYSDASGAYLVVGDTGDNLRWRPQVSLYVVAEPTTLAAQQDTALRRQIDVRYPDGPQDVEAMAVDMVRQRILLLSKRTHPARLYSVPLYASGEVLAEAVGVLQFPLPTVSDYRMEPRFAQYKYMPSGMSVLADKLLVTTKKPAFLFDLADLQAPPLLIDLPSLGQREAISFAAGDDRKAYMSRERSGRIGVADLFAISFD